MTTVITYIIELCFIKGSGVRMCDSDFSGRTTTSSRERVSEDSWHLLPLLSRKDPLVVHQQQEQQVQRRVWWWRGRVAKARRSES